MTTNWSNEETFKFIELYRKENCLWNPKNKQNKIKSMVVNSWKRIADEMGVPVYELKKKKESLLATFRKIARKKILSIKSGAGEEDVYQPIWMFYDALEAFLMDVYESNSLLSNEEKMQSEETSSLPLQKVFVEASTTNAQAGNNLSEPETDNDTATPTHRASNSPVKKRKAPELIDASKQMNTTLTTLISSMAKKKKLEDEDDCDLFCKLLAKQLKKFPQLEREEIMYDIHGLMINKRRCYERMMQIRPDTVSSPSQACDVRFSDSPSPSYNTDSACSVESLPQNRAYKRSETIEVEIDRPEASRLCYESFGNEIHVKEEQEFSDT